VSSWRDRRSRFDTRGAPPAFHLCLRYSYSDMRTAGKCPGLPVLHPYGVFPIFQIFVMALACPRAAHSDCSIKPVTNGLKNFTDKRSGVAFVRRENNFLRIRWNFPKHPLPISCGGKIFSTASVTHWLWTGIHQEGLNCCYAISTPASLSAVRMSL
jgi:hypothetical protein